MTRPPVRITTALLAALVAAGAGGALPAVAKAPATHKAKVVSDYFSPSKITIKLGDRVRWTWDSSGFEQHDVTVDSGPATFASPTQSAGTYTHRFTKAGTYHLYCTVHEDMTETVIVKKKKAAKRGSRR
jgi:plastocyanin